MPLHFTRSAFARVFTQRCFYLFATLLFSFTVLTTTGFGDIAPVHRIARTLATLEAVLGTLYVAILIARLAGIYPARAEE